MYLVNTTRSTSGFAHRRIENEEDMEFGNEFGNPTFKYSRQTNEEEEEDAVDAPFTIRDHKVWRSKIHLLDKWLKVIHSNKDT